MDIRELGLLNYLRGIVLFSKRGVNQIVFL